MKHTGEFLKADPKDANFCNATLKGSTRIRGGTYADLEDAKVDGGDANLKFLSKITNVLPPARVIASAIAIGIATVAALVAIAAIDSYIIATAAAAAVIVVAVVAVVAVAVDAC